MLMLLLTSCSGGDFCHISDTGDSAYAVTVDDGDSVYFYADEELCQLSVHAMVWNYDTEQYDIGRTVCEGITLKAGQALKITLDLEYEMPYTAVRFMRRNGDSGERFIYRDGNGKLWLLQQY